MCEVLNRKLVSALPILNAQARALTRNRADAEDLVQDVVANVLAAAQAPSEDTAFTAWARRILRNRFLDNLRRRRRQEEFATALQQEPSTGEATQLNCLAARELQCAVARLSAEQREAFLLIALKGMSCEQAALVCGCGVSTAARRLVLARRNLELWMLGGEAAEPGHRGATRPRPRGEPLPMVRPHVADMGMSDMGMQVLEAPLAEVVEP